jgi:hypothetical protein
VMTPKVPGPMKLHMNDHLRLEDTATQPGGLIERGYVGLASRMMPKPRRRRQKTDLGSLKMFTDAFLIRKYGEKCTVFQS